MKTIDKHEGEVLIETDKPILLVQILIIIWFISIPVSLIIGALNIWSSFDIGFEGVTVFVIPMLLLGLVTLDGTPCKKKWVKS